MREIEGAIGINLNGKDLIGKKKKVARQSLHI